MFNFNVSGSFNNKKFKEARSHGLVVKGEDSQLSGCGFESWHCILDGCKRLLQLKINENKGSQMGHTKKKKNIYKKKIQRSML